ASPSQVASSRHRPRTSRASPAVADAAAGVVALAAPVRTSKLDLLFPVTYRVNAAGHMEVGGCDLIELARRHGTPLYVYDEATVRQRASEYIAAMDGAGQVELLRNVVPHGSRAQVMLRISPGVKPDTHDHISTGQLDSKFGFSIESGAARKAVETALQHPSLELVGLHSHIGSQIF